MSSIVFKRKGSKYKDQKVKAPSEVKGCAQCDIWSLSRDEVGNQEAGFTAVPRHSGGRARSSGT